MTSKVSRAALIAAIAVGASGLVAASADATAVTTAGVSTANYYVNGPTVAGVSDLTPESVVLNGAVDTGGSPLTTLSVPAGQTLLWQNTFTIGSATSAAAQSFDVDGLPSSGSNSTVSVTVNDAAVSANSQFLAVSNGGADNYSVVTFQYDPVKDYVASGDTAGPDLQSATAIQVPTAAGISPVSEAVGAFGVNAQNNTGNTPLTPGTAYYYWLQSQAGETNAAESINIAQWYDTTGSAAATEAGTSFVPDPNPTYKCYPDAAIAEDPALASYTTATTINYGGTTAPAIQPGGCNYIYGNTGGSLPYVSPTGEFKTPALGKLIITAKASASQSKAVLSVADASGYKAGGNIELTTSAGKELAAGNFSLAANAKGAVTLKLTGAGKKLVDVKAKPGRKATKKHKAVKGTPATVKTGIKTKLVLTSNWGQPTSTKSVTL